MKLGIIITSYNNQETIENAIQSAYKLKKKNKIYIVLIDDCSNDLTIKFANKAKRKNQIDILHINNKNLGISKCRNIGINFSQGRKTAMD